MFFPQKNGDKNMSASQYQTALTDDLFKRKPNPHIELQLPKTIVFYANASTVVET